MWFCNYSIDTKDNVYKKRWVKIEVSVLEKIVKTSLDYKKLNAYFIFRD